MQRYLVCSNEKVILVPSGEEIDLSRDHPCVGTTKYGDLWSRDCTVKETYKELDPRLHYNTELQVLNTLESDSPDYIVDALKEQEYQRRTDKLTSQITRLSIAGEVDKAAEAEHLLAIENAKIQEEFGKPTIVYITATGDHYHTDPDCIALTNCTTKEVPLSTGLQDYTACTLCTDME